MTTPAQKVTIKKITVLGSGTSTGIPMLGCDCVVCTSPAIENKRLRSSILITTSEDKNILVDTSPDLRTQLLRENIKKIDAVILTHNHADHVHGIDDLRPFTFSDIGGPITIYTSDEMKDVLEKRFSYIFKSDKDKSDIGGGIPKLNITTVIHSSDDLRSAQILGLDFNFFFLPHGHINTMTFQTGSFTYLIDCHEIPKNRLDWLQSLKLDLVFIDCVTDNPEHKTHLSVDRTVRYLEAISPKRAGLIHMGHKLEHFALKTLIQSKLGPNFWPLTDREVFKL
jgi:phosphoribosyl 1,2-cyclic phosphate phosphodiesterase